MKRDKTELDVPISELVTAIWAEVLNIPAPSLGCRDHFFDLGGDSLGAVLVCTYIEEKLGRAFSFSTFLAAPTIEGIVSHLSETAESPSKR